MKSVLSLYIVWSVILAIHGSWVVLTSDFGEKIGEDAYHHYLPMFYLGFVLFFLVGAFFAWFTQQGKSWATWLFVAFCVYRSIDYLWGVTVRDRMENVAVNTADWSIGIIIAVIWLALAGYTLYLRPNKTLKSGTPQSGVP